MALQPLNRDEDRNFADGETVFDVDGNAYTVRGDRAELNANDAIGYWLTWRIAEGHTDTPGQVSMRDCFSRNNPKADAVPRIPIDDQRTDDLMRIFEDLQGAQRRIARSLSRGFVNKHSIDELRRQIASASAHVEFLEKGRD